MNNEDAVKIVKTVGWGYPENMHTEAVMMVIDALESKSKAEEYRTPKKVDVWHIKETNCDIQYCPTCHQDLGEFWPKYEEVPSYCTYCGQALKWEVDE